MIEHVNELAIVFASSDQDNVIYEEYYASMPWFSLPYEKQLTNVHALGTTDATICIYMNDLCTHLLLSVSIIILHSYLVFIRYPLITSYSHTHALHCRHKVQCPRYPLSHRS
jgi:hypothetical protein